MHAVMTYRKVRSQLPARVVLCWSVVGLLELQFQVVRVASGRLQLLHYSMELVLPFGSLLRVVGSKLITWFTALVAALCKVGTMNFSG